MKTKSGKRMVVVKMERIAVVRTRVRLKFCSCLFGTFSRMVFGRRLFWMLGKVGAIVR